MKTYRILIFCILLAATCTVARSETFLDRVTLAAAYGHSFNGGWDSLIGKLTVDVFAVKLPLGKQLTFGGEIITIPDSETLEVGLGASATIKNMLLGLNVGVGYFPRHGWGWNVGIVHFTF